MIGWIRQLLDRLFGPLVEPGVQVWEDSMLSGVICQWA